MMRYEVYRLRRWVLTGSMDDLWRSRLPFIFSSFVDIETGMLPILLFICLNIGVDIAFRGKGRLLYQKSTALGLDRCLPACHSDMTD